MLVETWVEEFASAANDDRMHALSALVAVLSGVERAAVQFELKYAEKKFDLINALPSELALRIFSMLDGVRTLAYASAVSRGWRDVAISCDALWVSGWCTAAAFSRELPIPPPSETLLKYYTEIVAGFNFPSSTSDNTDDGDVTRGSPSSPPIVGTKEDVQHDGALLKHRSKGDGNGGQISTLGPAAFGAARAWCIAYELMLHRLKAAPKSVWTLNPDAGRLPAIVMVSSVNIPITEETPAQHNGHGADDFVHQSVARHGGGTVESESIQGSPKCVDVIISGGSNRKVSVWILERLKNGLQTQPKMFAQHPAPSTCSLVADAEMIAVGSFDGSITAMRLLDGFVLFRSRGHTSPVCSLATNARHGILVSGSYDNSLRIWDRSTGVALCTMLGAHESTLNSVFILAHPSERLRIVSASESAVKVWDGTSLLSKSGEAAAGNAGGVDGGHQPMVVLPMIANRAVSGCEGVVQVHAGAALLAYGSSESWLCALPTLEPLQEFNLTMHVDSPKSSYISRSAITCCAVGEGFMVLGSGMDLWLVRIDHVGTGDSWTPCLQVLKHRGAVAAVHISPDGKSVLTASANTVTVFDWPSYCTDR